MFFILQICSIQVESSSPFTSLQNALAQSIEYCTDSMLKTDMQKVAATRPLVAEIFSDCGRKKAGIPLNLWKLSDWILWMTTFWHDDCGNTSNDLSERSNPAWFLIISLIMLQINYLSPNLRMSQVTHFRGNVRKSKFWPRKDSNFLHVWFVHVRWVENTSFTLIFVNINPCTLSYVLYLYIYQFLLHSWC